MPDKGVIYVRDVLDSQGASASEMTYTVSGGTLNSVHY